MALTTSTGPTRAASATKPAAPPSPAVEAVQDAEQTPRLNVAVSPAERALRGL